MSDETAPTEATEATEIEAAAETAEPVAEDAPKPKRRRKAKAEDKLAGRIYGAPGRGTTERGSLGAAPEQVDRWAEHDLTPSAGESVPARLRDRDKRGFRRPPAVTDRHPQGKSAHGRGSV